MARPVFTADASLVEHLRNFYSIGQLQLFYCTLTDAGELPGWSDRKRAEWTDGITQVLNIETTLVTRIEPLPDPEPQQELDAEYDVSPEALALFPLEKAQKVAKIICDMIEEYCDRIHVAGSIRRQKAEVKDVEIVCQPKRFAEADFSLFGGNAEMKVAPAFRRTVEHGLGEVIKGKADGRYMQILLPSRMKLDLFMPVPHDFYRQYAIRTGSREYSAQVLAVGWKKLGWCGTPDGLRRISQCEETKAGGWKCHAENPTLPPVWKSEEEFFEWLQIKWVAPKLRTVK